MGGMVKSGVILSLDNTLKTVRNWHREHAAPGSCSYVRAGDAPVQVMQPKGPSFCSGFWKSSQPPYGTSVFLLCFSDPIQILNSKLCLWLFIFLNSDLYISMSACIPTYISLLGYLVPGLTGPPGSWVQIQRIAQVMPGYVHTTTILHIPLWHLSPNDPV